MCGRRCGGVKCVVWWKRVWYCCLIEVLKAIEGHEMKMKYIKKNVEIKFFLNKQFRNSRF